MNQQPALPVPKGGLLPLTAASPDGRARLLFLHAHPDDESITTGATMAAFARSGALVYLLTSTRGELGEVIPPELRHLEVGQPGNADDGSGLAAVREQELADAVAALGIADAFWLGSGAAKAGTGPDVIYRDSGMSWGPDGRAQPAATVLPGSFSLAPLEETAAHAAALIRRLKPDVVVTYAADGGYGHPDHVRTAAMALQAVELAADIAVGAGALDPWRVPLAYTIVSDRPERPLEPGAAVIDVDGDLAAKTAAMRAHRTQLTVLPGQRFALSDGVSRELSGRESFQPVDAGTDA